MTFNREKRGVKLYEQQNCEIKNKEKLSKIARLICQIDLTERMARARKSLPRCDKSGRRMTGGALAMVLLPAETFDFPVQGAEADVHLGGDPFFSF